MEFAPDYDEIGGDGWDRDGPTRVVAESFEPGEDSRRDFAAGLRSVSVTVMVDGEPLTGRHRVKLEILEAGSEGTARASERWIFEAGAGVQGDEEFRGGELTVPLVPGDYRMRIEVMPSYTETFGAQEATQTVTRELSIPGTDRVAVDFPVDRHWVEVGGTVAGLPELESEDGARMVSFLSAESGQSSFRELPEGDPADFELQVLVGTHDV